MASSQPTNVASIRRLRILALILAVSNLLLGGFSAYLLQSTDKAYSELIDRMLPVLNQVRSTGRNAASAYLDVIASLVTVDPVKCAVDLNWAKKSLEDGRLAREAVLTSEFLKGDPALSAELEENGVAYETAMKALFPRVTAENTTDRERDTLEQLQAIYEKYHDTIARTISAIEKQTEATSDQYTRQTKSRSIFVIGFGSWPLGIIAGIMALAIVVILGMAVAYYRAGAGDGP